MGAVEELLVKRQFQPKDRQLTYALTGNVKANR